MKAIHSLKTLAGGTVLSLALLAGTAQADMMTNEETAAKIQQALEMNPDLGQYAIDVNADDEKVVISGMVEDMEHAAAIQEIVDGMADVDNIENNIIQN